MEGESRGQLLVLRRAQVLALASWVADAARAASPDAVARRAASPDAVARKAEPKVVGTGLDVCQWTTREPHVKPLQCS